MKPSPPRNLQAIVAQAQESGDIHAFEIIDALADNGVTVQVDPLRPEIAGPEFAYYAVSLQGRADGKLWHTLQYSLNWVYSLGFLADKLARAEAPGDVNGHYYNAQGGRIDSAHGRERTPFGHGHV